MATDPTSNHAFLSYVRENGELVTELEQALNAADIPVWRDVNDLWPGDVWKHRIRDAIRGDALAFIACFSTQSVEKHKSHMNEELRLAVEELRQMQPGQTWFIPV